MKPDKRGAEEKRLIEEARHQRSLAVSSRADLIRYREEFGIYAGWGHGNPEMRGLAAFAGRQSARKEGKR